MRVAALYDIHGNVPALHATLAELEVVKPDLIVIGGDIISGPMPVQTLEMLFQLDIPVQFIRGNGDREVVLAFDGEALALEMSDSVREITSWVAEQLNRSHRDFLAQLPLTYTLEREDFGDVLFCHAIPTNDEDIFTPLTSDAVVATYFEGTQQRTVICGHTHVQFERRLGDLRILNAGSVGMPFADKPGAYWLLLDGDRYEHRFTLYDVEAAAKQIASTNYPQAKQFAEENVRKIPTAQEAMEFLEALAQKNRPSTS
ncbi:metallophosphoesterase [Brevibacillus sp. Leaf182]|uniref:metallophosphoesterase family protein n=1 Tax=Brevibacillus sp. Leaf182 TaxID=1736290 RepID=UPI0007013F61|nr:metallophosphoesterase family protein [Brevibacillus sp. Leaf182]RAT95847.1 metallophosphoesterase [Brevibacillus sp. Leaf182]